MRRGDRSIFRGIGCHPFHVATGILLNEANMAYSPCIRCETCDGFPCLVHGKYAEIIAVRPALENPNVTLLRHARALRPETTQPATVLQAC
jgi:hypothetical protein